MILVLAYENQSRSVSWREFPRCTFLWRDALKLQLSPTSSTGRDAACSRGSLLLRGWAPLRAGISAMRAKEESDFVRFWWYLLGRGIFQRSSHRPWHRDSKHLSSHRTIPASAARGWCRPSCRSRCCVGCGWRLSTQNHRFWDSPEWWYAYVVKEDILWFDIAVDDIFRVHILEPFAYLSDIRRSFCLTDFSLLFHLHQRPIWHNLENEVDIGLVIEESIDGG